MLPRCCCCSSPSHVVKLQLLLLLLAPKTKNDSGSNSSNSTSARARLQGDDEVMVAWLLFPSQVLPVLSLSLSLSPLLLGTSDSH